MSVHEFNVMWLLQRLLYKRVGDLKLMVRNPGNNDGHYPVPAIDKSDKKSKDIRSDFSSNKQQEAYNGPYHLDGMKMYLYNLTGINYVAIKT